VSVELVNTEISNFLTRGQPEVLCIRGKWGVGKTHAWTTQLQQAQAAGKIALPRYSYVSLFGINSLDELKFSIFENVVTPTEGQLRADIDTLHKFIESNLNKTRKFTKFVQTLPVVRSIISDKSSTILSFLTIRNQIICFDDMERRGNQLDIGDVLGLVSLLREQRACKVVLILNDEALTGDAKEKFEAYLEKVVDVSLVYKPTAAESVGIALPDDNLVSRRIAELCTSLGISNIRIIKRIERVIHAIQPLLAKFDEDVFKQVSTSLVLFCWSHGQPEDAPTLDFLMTKKARSLFGLQKDEDFSENEAAWNALLGAYGYTWTDDFDLALIEGVRNGYFDTARIEKFAQELQDKVVATKADGSFEDAWRLYHDSFKDNQEEVLDTLYTSFMKNFQYITPLNLNGIVTLFKDLGRNNAAAEMIKHYVDNRAEPRSFFDLENYPFGDSITDPDVRHAFGAKCVAGREKLDVPGILLQLDDSWSDEMIAVLVPVTVEEYRDAFKSAEGKDLRKMLSGVLRFHRIVNASAEMKEIAKRAREALMMIGKESPINARRVAKFGINVNASADDAKAVV
jgi:hypothetical protein